MRSVRASLFLLSLTSFAAACGDDSGGSGGGTGSGGSGATGSTTAAGTTTGGMTLSAVNVMGLVDAGSYEIFTGSPTGLHTPHTSGAGAS